jgi:hypothetical protein
MFDRTVRVLGHEVYVRAWPRFKSLCLGIDNNQFNVDIVNGRLYVTLGNLMSYEPRVSLTVNL